MEMPFSLTAITLFVIITYFGCGFPANAVCIRRYSVLRLFTICLKCITSNTYTKMYMACAGRIFPVLVYFVASE